MKANAGGSWKQASPSAKVAGAWKVISGLYVNVQGVWKAEAHEVISTNQISDLLANTSGWQLDSTRGWYKNDYDWGVDLPVKFSADILNRIRKISAEFTGYANTPAGCLGTNIINITTNQRTVMLGTYDSHADNQFGQDVHQGDAGPLNTAGNVLNVVMTLTLQANEVVSALAIQSSGYTNPGQPYPYALRGMKNFRFELV